MNTNFEHFSAVIDYIEKNLDLETDYTVLARMLSLSVYEFRRIFSFIAGVLVYEYIKNRRLSKSVFDLKSTALSITEIACKYHYDSASAYARAFKGLFGITPSAARLEAAEIKLYPKLNIFKITEDCPRLSLKIIKTEGFYVCGVQGLSDSSDTVCCESVWKTFEASSYASAGDIYAIYENGADGCVRCTIGEKSDKPNQDSVSLYVAPSQRMCFKICGGDTNEINGIYEQIFSVYIPGSGYRRQKSMPNVEFFSNGDTWEIQIPIEKE